MELSRRHPLRLTWEGHEFLDAARSEMRWQKVKASVDKIDGLPFALIKTALLEMDRQEAAEHLPCLSDRPLADRGWQSFPTSQRRLPGQLT